MTSTGLTELQWRRAIAVASNMLAARGFDTISEEPLDRDEDEGSSDANDDMRGWWIVGELSSGKLKPGTASHVLNNTKSMFLFTPSTGCVGKSMAKTILTTIQDKYPHALDIHGRVALVHSSRLSTDASRLMASNNVQVFSGAELQFDRLDMLHQRGILKDVVVQPCSRDNKKLRRWLSTDPMSRYFGLTVGCVFSWTTAEDRRRAIVVPPPPFSI